MEQIILTADCPVIIRTFVNISETAVEQQAQRLLLTHEGWMLYSRSRVYYKAGKAFAVTLFKNRSE